MPGLVLVFVTLVFDALIFVQLVFAILVFVILVLADMYLSYLYLPIWLLNTGICFVAAQVFLSPGVGRFAWSHLGSDWNTIFCGGIMMGFVW